MIELLLGFSPDGGNESLEITIFISLLALAFLTLRRKKTSKSGSVLASRPLG
jgi:hypothetical protein